MRETAAQLAIALRKAALFGELSDTEMEFLASRAVSRQFRASELIFSEGDPCEGMYIIESGNVRIFTTSRGGREQVLAVDGPGSSIAELPVFDDGPYPASAQAVTDARLILVSKQNFRALCLEHPQVALKVIKVVGRRLRRLVGIIEELSFSTVRHRLLALLLQVARHSGRKTARGTEFSLPATNQELAAMIGTVRELVSRNLSRLQAEGMLQIQDRNVVISDLARLQSELDSAE